MDISLEPSVLEEAWHILNGLLFLANWVLFIGGMLAAVIRLLRAKGRLSSSFLMFGSLCTYTHIVAGVVMVSLIVLKAPFPGEEGLLWYVFTVLFFVGPSVLGVGMWWLIRRRAIREEPSDKVLDG